MYRIPTITTAILIIIAASATAYLIQSTSLFLNDAQLVSSLIALFGCLGALISVTFVVYIYIQTNRVLLIGQKPCLLIQIQNKKLQTNSQQKDVVPITSINYSNTSQNEFNDLTLYVKLQVRNRKWDISDLFTPNMFMAAQDRRQRNFKTLSYFYKRGIDINKATAYGYQVILSTHYTFTFNNKLEERQGPEYKWNSRKQLWMPT